ncbi:MAG: Bug family tripartite tricarboxylate transporter substrate binding protein [Beijerinckiaceae bacterium]
MKKLAAAFAFATLSVATASAEPAAYPQKVVTLVTHSSPGGGSDVFLREMVKHLGKYINATFIVENVSGGSGARAMSKLATAKPDGSTFYAITPTYIYTSLMSKPQHTFRDLQPLAIFFADPEVLYTRADGPYKSVKDVIDHARKARGRFGVANPASLERQAAERLKAAAKVNAAIVSHEGGGDLMINVLNGTLDAGVGEIQELRAQLAGNKVRLLGSFTEKRLADFPDLPTVKEQGFDVVVHKFRGLAGPKGLSPEVIAIWEKAIPQLLADPEYKKVYAQESLIVDFRGSAAATQLVNTFAAESEAFLKETGVIK